MFRTLPNNQTYIYFELGATSSSGPKTEEAALAEFFGIDIVKLENEKRAMIDEMRAAHAK